jgi:hypothetical protein
MLCAVASFALNEKYHRGVINGKAGKTASSLPKELGTLNLSQPGGADYANPLALLAWKNYLITPLYHHAYLLHISR